jgi:hypothetical protein
MSQSIVDLSKTYQLREVMTEAVSLTSFAPPQLMFSSVFNCRQIQYDAPYAKGTRTTLIIFTCQIIKLQVTKPKPRPLSERRFSLNR